MSDDGLTQLFQTQFSTLLRMNLQQKTSKLRGKTEEGSHVGSKMASPIQFVPPMQMKTPEGRFAPKKNTAAAYSRRWIVPIDYEGDQYVDSFDQLKTPIDPKSQLVARAAAACARNWDSEVIRAANASVVSEPASEPITDAAVAARITSLSQLRAHAAAARATSCDFGSVGVFSWSKLSTYWSPS